MHISSERAVLIAAILASSMVFIDSSALDVAARALQINLGLDVSQQLWVINIYTLMLSALILTGGSLGDHLGRKRVFMIGIVLFSAASIVCGLAQTAPVLIAARAVQGIGGALTTPGSLALIAATFEPERRGTAIGTWSTFSTLTSLLGPALGGALVDWREDAWRLIFFVNVPLALLSLWLLITRVPESRDTHAPAQIDWLGALLVTLGLGGVTFGFTEGPRLGFADPLVLFALIGGVLALVGFTVVQMRSSHPMVPPRLFRSRTFTGTNLLTLLLYAPLGALPFFLLINLQVVQGYPESLVGLTFLPLGILLVLMSRWAGGLVNRIGARLPLTVGPALAGLGFAALALPGITGGPSDYWISFFPAVLLIGVGMGLTVAPLTVAVMGAAPTDSAGTASGVSNAVARTARVLALPAFGAIMVLSFQAGLQGRAAALDLPPEIQSALVMEASRLGAAEVPPGLDEAQASAAAEVIRLAFVDAFRLLALVAAGLAFLSAVMGWLLVEDERQKRSDIPVAVTPSE